MRCTHCGFVSNKDFYVCPYCGTVYQPDNNVLRKIINIGGVFSVSVRALIYIIVLNALGLTLLIDWYLGFNFALILWAFMGAAVVVTYVSIKSYKPNPITSMEKIIFFFYLVLILCIPLFRMNTLDGASLFDFTFFFPTIIIPIFLTIAVIVSIVVLIFKGRSQKIRPIWTEALLLFQLTLASLLFIFCLMDRHYLNVTSSHLFPYFGKIAEHNLYTLSQTLIFIAFGASMVCFINYNIVITGHIVREVKNAYGKRPG